MIVEENNPWNISVWSAIFDEKIYKTNFPCAVNHSVSVLYLKKILSMSCKMCIGFHSFLVTQIAIDLKLQQVCNIIVGVWLMCAYIASNCFVGKNKSCNVPGRGVDLTHILHKLSE